MTASVTRLITGGLQGGGITTLGKTTGTMPCYIDPTGTQVRIQRIGKAIVFNETLLGFAGHHRYEVRPCAPRTRLVRAGQFHR